MLANGRLDNGNVCGCPATSNITHRSLELVMTGVLQLLTIWYVMTPAVPSKLEINQD
jgi:hypothetical protein